MQCASLDEICGKFVSSDLFGEVARDPLDLNGVRIWPGALDGQAQSAMVDDLRKLARDAPFRQYETPSGRKMSVRMTAAGRVGWMSDRQGYRYSEAQPNGAPWPAIPASVLKVWERFSGVDCTPDSCLVNFYSDNTRMGLHQDRDEGDLSWPVVSISLGDDALFRVGGAMRKSPTKSHWLHSGDVAVLSGAGRLAFHGIDRIKFGSSDLLPEAGRINVTLRVVR